MLLRTTSTYPSSAFTRQDMTALFGTRPATSTVQTTQCPDGYVPYTLKSGDTLYAIAMTHGVTVNELLFYNPGLNPYGYRAGETICIPASAQAPAAGNNPAEPGEGSAGLPTPSVPSAPETDAPAQPDAGPVPLPTPSVPAKPVVPAAPACENGMLYTVRSGDTLRSIAQRFDITLSALMAANPGNTNNRLIMGQQLCIPMAACAVCCPQGTTTVRSGSDSFVDLLINYNISYAALAAANPSLDWDALKAGTAVCIPPAGSRGSCSEGTATLELAQDITAAELAQQLDITVAQLMRLNPTYRPTDFLAGRIICAPSQAQ